MARTPVRYARRLIERAHGGGEFLTYPRRWWETFQKNRRCRNHLAPSTLLRDWSHIYATSRIQHRAGTR